MKSMLGKVSLAALGWSVVAGAALAQAPGQPASSAQAASTSGIGEVVVTARKRAETLQDVPMAVTGLSSEQLEQANVTETPALFARVPNLYFTTAGGAAPSSDFTYLVIRGVGYNGGLEPATGVFIDGMYQPQLGFDVGFLDLERVEVLRGPQGTLFGRNTQAGAINLITRQPGSDTTGRVEAEVAEFNTYRVRGSVSGALSPTLFAGIAAQYSDTDGYIDNATVGGDYDFARKFVTRANLRWTPSDTLEILASADYNRSRFNDQGFGVPLAPERYDALADQDESDEKSGGGAQVTVNWEITDSVTFTSQSGWRRVESDILLDDDANVTNRASRTLGAVPLSTTTPPVPLSVALSPITVSGTAQRVDLSQDFWSQELRLSGSSDRLDWLFGAYYFEQEMDQFRSRDIGPGVPFATLYIRESFLEKRDGYAAFGQASYRPIERLELTVGGRYSQENVETGGDRVLNINDASISAFKKIGEADFNDFSPMASASFDLTEDALVYATFAQGWKAGGINRFPSRPNAIVPYDSETSQSYELGLKAGWLDGRLRTNLALYHIDIEDQQLLLVIPDPQGLTPITAISNAAESRSRGFEIDVDAELAPRLILRGTYGYTDAKFRDFIQTGTGTSKDRSGEQFDFVPEETASASLAYTHALASSELEFYLSYRYVGDYTVPDVALSSPLAAQLRVPSYDRVDAKVSWTRDQFKLSAYVNNVFDTFDYTNITRGQYAPQSDPTRYVQVLPPRQIGVIASYSF